MGNTVAREEERAQSQTMCNVTADQCPEPTQVGIWWRDDAAWKRFSEDAMVAILSALLKDQKSLQLPSVKSVAHPHGAAYTIDLSKMEQINKLSGHRRPIKLVLPTYPALVSCSLQKEELPQDGPATAVWFRMDNSCLLAIHRGDISKWSVDGATDAVVNASRGSRTVLKAASRVYGRCLNGVEDALISAAGPQLEEAMQKAASAGIDGGVTGTGCRPMITSSFNLPSAKIIHIRGPAYNQGDPVASSALLENVYKTALTLAMCNGVRYIAFPAVSCGAGCFPLDLAARIALRVVSSDDANIRLGNRKVVMEIHFILLDEKAWEEWTKQATQSFKKEDIDMT